MEHSRISLGLTGMSKEMCPLWHKDQFWLCRLASEPALVPEHNRTSKSREPQPQEKCLGLVQRGELSEGELSVALG